MICQHCKNEVGSAAFCPFCGQRVSAAPQSAPVPPGQPSQQPPKKSKAGLIIGICIAVVLIAAAVLLFVFLADPGKSDGDTTPSKPDVIPTEEPTEKVHVTATSPSLLIKTDASPSWSREAALFSGDTAFTFYPAVTSTDDTSKWHSVFAEDHVSSDAKAGAKWAAVDVVRCGERGEGVFMTDISLKLTGDGAASEKVYLNKADFTFTGPMADAFYVMITTANGDPICTIGSTNKAPAVWTDPITDDVDTYSDPPEPTILHKKAGSYSTVSDSVELGKFYSSDEVIDLRLYVWLDGTNSSVTNENAYSDSDLIKDGIRLGFILSSDMPAAPTVAKSVPEGATPVTDANGEVISYYKNDYDDEGHLLCNTEYDANGVLLGSTAYEYDEYGNDIKITMYGSDGSILSVIKYEKTPEGLETKRTDMNGNGEITSIITTEYTDFDQEKSRSVYNGDGSLKERAEYEYDANRILSKETRYDSSGKVTGYTTYEIDTDGGTIEREYDADGNLVI